MKRVTPFIASAAMLLLGAGAEAAWIENGVPACVATGVQEQPQIVEDGSGGVIAIWIDSRNGNKDIYAQRIDGDGNALWAPYGIPVCTAPYDQINIMAIPDGAGGIIVAWQDYRYGMTEWRRYQYMIHAQRIDGSGTALWLADGLPVCPTRGTQERPALVSDGQRGAVIAWLDFRQGGAHGIYAQRVSAGGFTLWNEYAVNLWLKPYYIQASEYPSIASDGAGGAIVAWNDYRSGTNRDIYARKVDASGAVTWGPNGVPVCVTPAEQMHPCLASDGAGGAIVAWTEGAAGGTDVRAQRLAGNGGMLWAAEGIPVSTAYGDQNYPRIVSDGAGGAIIAWNQFTSPSPIGVQRLDGAGSAVWTINGVPVPLSIYEMYTFPLASDGAGGAIVAGRRYVSGVNQVVAERFDASGQRTWLPDGIILCTTVGQKKGVHIVGDGLGGAFVAWQDLRSDGGDIYVARALGETPPIQVRLDIRPEACPNPFNPKSKGVLPAAILGMADLDVRDIDPESIRIEGVAPLRWSYEDVAAPPVDGSECACTSAGPDGFLDLALKFDLPALASAIGSAAPGSMVVMGLEGFLEDDTAIEGRDCVRIVGGSGKDPEARLRLSMGIHSSPRDAVQRLGYTLPVASAVEIAVYDVSGRLVQRFERVFEPAGTHVREWDTAGLATGIYFCRVRSATLVETKKILILR